MMLGLLFINMEAPSQKGKIIKQLNTIKLSRRGSDMMRMTAVLGGPTVPHFTRMLALLRELPVISRIIVIAPELPVKLPAQCEYLAGNALATGDILNRLAAVVDTPQMLFLSADRELCLGPAALERLAEVAATTGAGMVYADYQESFGGERREHPVNDYQLGSIREDFDFGSLLLFSTEAVRESLQRWGPVVGSEGAGLYDLRLKVSLNRQLYRIREYLYTVAAGHAAGGLFAYVDPRNYDFQKELEGIATAHLRRLGAYLEPRDASLPPARQTFSMEASVIIPVRNRVNTITEAVQSALAQEADFTFNVLVVDNHSTDGTTAALAALAGKHPTLKHIIPARLDLTIGGCWNEAVFSPQCGRYAVQLDSDDLYRSPHSLRKMVDLLRGGPYAMAIGSYTLVNGALEEIPPGLIDHREWTESNGLNNALRVNGLGAPRAFNTELLRNVGLLNVGYGEDYAVALRLARDYRIGRIYESLYLCRRWGGNSDAALTIEKQNRYDAFKDQIRTLEITARQQLNANLHREKE